MKYISTSNRSEPVTFSEAVNRGIADDGGLYMPESIPVFPSNFFPALRGATFQEVSLRVAKRLLGDDIGGGSLEKIVYESLTFSAPLHFLDEHTAILELFHGPTLAFKDFGARFMARTLAYLHRGDRNEITVLVATSGDTGSAVANGFAGVDGVRVVMLYPSGRVSPTQELQMTTIGGNVAALEIDGTFDDCQHLVKQAFADRDIMSRRRLTSANSINVARLIPQTFYYFYAFAQLSERSHSVIFSVPSGNLGNLTAGLIAWKMGLPVDRFVAGTNINDSFPRYLAGGVFAPTKAVATISSAMDVGDPSNLARISALFKGDVVAIRRILEAASFSDIQTREGIEEVYARYQYVLDPHGAVAYRAAQHLRSRNHSAATAIVLGTAHPAKFMEVYSQEAIRMAINVPKRLASLPAGAKHSIRIPARANDLKEFLLGQ